MKKNRCLHHTALALLLLMPAWGCGSKETSEQAAPGSGGGPGRKILRIAYEREIDLLNPFTSQNLVDIGFSMIEGLITTDENNRYIPVLATEIPTEENGLILRHEDGTVDMTWPLQRNVLWHDGEEFTSEDVCFTWRFVTSPNSETYNREQYLGIKDCLMPDDHTVVFRWDGSYAYYAGLFEAVLPEHILGGMTAEEIVSFEPYNRGRKTIGTGPFKFAEWKSGEYIRVIRNEKYWRGAAYPRIDEIVWSFIPDPNTRLNAVKSGGYDFCRIEPTQVAEVANLAQFDVHLIRSNGFTHFDVSANTDRGRALFGDAAVRKAMFHAIDREAIAAQLMQGTVTIAHTPVNPGNPYHNPDVTKYDFDPELSERMLDEAGWRVGADDIREKDGMRFAFVMMNRSGRVNHIAIAQVIQAQLKNVGIEVTFETLENAAWTQRWRSGQWEGIVSNWYLPADPSFTNLYACDGANNMKGICDPELDEIMKRSDRFLNFQDRKLQLDAAQERLAEAAISLPIYYNVIPEIVSTRVENYEGSGTNFGSFWNLYEWDLRR